jgi:hypothetical protein
LSKKYSLKGAIPEFTNIKVGSSLVTIGADGTIKCDFSWKKFKKVARISCDFIKTDVSNDLGYINLFLITTAKKADVKHFCKFVTYRKI